MPNEQADGDQATGTAPAEGTPLFTSDAALSLEEARNVSGRRGVTVVLLIGEVGVGKTTLLVELWNLLLMEGSICGYSFAGSRTALAFEARAFPSRLEARIGAATTIRTQDESEGFLHLRIQRPDGTLREVLFADVTGEHFRRIREGRALLDELAWAARVDRFLVIVDGEGFATPGVREVVRTRVRRQIYALRNSQAIGAAGRVAIVLTKLDRLVREHHDTYKEEEKSLLAEARNVDDRATAFRVAARPDNGTPTVGMGGLVKWVCAEDRSTDAESHALSISPARAIGRFTS